MVLQKRINYGFDGYKVPPMPRAARSARRNAFKVKGADQVSSFDLLATLAGKLLLESGGNSSSSSNNAFDNGDQCAVTQNHANKEPGDEDQTSRGEEEKKTYGNNVALPRFLVPEIIPEASNLVSTSVITSSASFDAPRFTYGSKNQAISSDGYGYMSEKCDNESMVGSLDEESKPLKNEHPHPHTASGYKKHAYGISRVGLESLELVHNENDNDEKSAHAYINGTTKSFKPSIRIGDGRLKRSLDSRDTTITKSDLDRMPHNCLSLRTEERNYPIKKRRYFDCYKLSHSEETIKKDHYGSPHKASAFSSSTADQKPTLRPRDSHVKLRIKSIRVPELAIEIPETSTVSSLKGMVLEAVNTVLGGGLRVDVLVQGKKIRDDSRMLLQTGISLDTISRCSDSLVFCLEPNPPPSRKPLCPKDSNCLLPFNVPQPLTRHLPTSGSRAVLSKRNSSVESNDNSKQSISRSTAGKTTPGYSRALVPLPRIQPQGIMLTSSRKPKRSEVAQRRIRRPFSVAEVETLVKAVEKLGTGRWRDVKLRAFDSSKHRTYVDLKDKWKTLVHTARISPQQRRGEPVPQELLDRVLTAHAYWSQQQHQQQGSNQTRPRPLSPETRLGL